MCNISTIMYHVIHDDHLEIKLIVLYCIVTVQFMIGHGMGSLVPALSLGNGIFISNLSTIERMSMHSG